MTETRRFFGDFELDPETFRLLKAGKPVFVDKPIDPDDLIQKIDWVLSHQKQHA